MRNDNTVHILTNVWEIDHNSSIKSILFGVDLICSFLYIFSYCQ